MDYDEALARALLERAWIQGQHWYEFQAARQRGQVADFRSYVLGLGLIAPQQLAEIEANDVLDTRRQAQTPPQSQSGDGSLITPAQASGSPYSGDAFASASLSLESSKIGPYQITGELGRGGFGVVFRARSPDGLDVALKLLTRHDPESISRFEREARLLKELSAESGFVPILDYGQAPQGPYFVMPFLSGGTLTEKIRKEGPLELEAALQLARTIGRAIGRAHERGIVHRDLKPENILFDASAQPRISDLGLGKHFNSGSAREQTLNLSATGQGFGTVGYMAPEQMKDARAVGPPADVFALGAIVYLCLSGEKAFHGESIFDVAAATARGDFVPLRERCPDCPPRLAALVESCLAIQQEDRPVDGLDFAAAFEDPELLEPEASGATLPLLAAVALALGSLIFATLWILSSLEAPPRPSPAPTINPPVPADPPKPTPPTLPKPVDPPPPLIARTLPKSLELPARIQIQGSGLTFRKILGTDVGKHAALITRVRTAYEGRIVATASLDGLVHIWNAETGQRLMTLSGVGDQIFSLAFSPDESELLAGGNTRGSIAVWSLATGSLRKVLRHEGRAAEFCFVDEGRTLVVAGSNSFSFWSWPDGTPKPAPAETGDWIKGAGGACQLEDGSLASFQGPALRVWEPLSGRGIFEKTLAFSDETPLDVHAMAAYPDSKRFALALGNGDIALFDRGSGAFRHFYGMEKLKGHPSLNHLRAVIITPGEKIISGGADGVARRWTSDLSEIEQRFVGHTSWIHDLAALPAEGEFISVGNDCSVRRWYSDGKEAWPRIGHSLQINGIAYDPRDQVLSAGLDGQLFSWPHRDQLKAAPLALYQLSSAIVNASFAADGIYAALSFGTRRVLVRELDSQRTWTTDVHDPKSGKDLKVSSLFLDTPNVLVGVDNGEALLLRFTEQGISSLGSTVFGATAVTAVSRSRIGDIAAGLADGGLRLARGSGADMSPKSLPSHRAGVTDLLFLDEDHLVSASSDGELRLNKLSTLSILHSQSLNKFGQVVGLALSPDGRYLAFARSYGAVSIIDWRSNRSVAQIVINNSWEYLNSLAFSRDGKELAVGASRGLIYTFEFKAPS